MTGEDRAGHGQDLNGFPLGCWEQRLGQGRPTRGPRYSRCCIVQFDGMKSFCESAGQGEGWDLEVYFLALKDCLGTRSYFPDLLQ